MILLNSIILEGETKKDQHYNFVDNEQKTLCQFSITTKRTVLSETERGEMVEEEYIIPCRAVGDIAKNVNRILNETDNQGIRIVGILKSDVSGVYVFAEHIEYRFSKGKKSK